MHYLYRITNKINNKNYIGQTVNYTQRFYNYKGAAKNNKPKQVIHHAMIKYGLQNFEFEVIACSLTLENTNYLEEELIKQYNSLAKDGYGYNVAAGGRNKPPSPEAIRKTALANTGKKRTEESKKKMSLSHLGKPTWNKGLPPEQQSRFGAKLSKEHIDILIESNKKKRKLTEEQVSEIRKRKKEENISFVQLGKEYNISESCIRDIINNKTYIT